ncbi:MAG: TolC family protein [Bacteroidota bacterium]
MKGFRLLQTAWIGLCVLIASQSLPAQNETTRIYSLEEVLQVALQKNPELATSRLEVQKADAQVMEAWGYALPAVDFSGQYSRALKKPVFFLPDFDDPKSGKIVPIEIGSDHAMNFSVTARQTLFNATVIVGVGAARVYRNVADELLLAKEHETIAKARKAYYGALLAAEVREMMRSTLQNAEENLRNVELLRQQGLLSEYDELRASVGVENLRPTVIQAENNYALALDGLRATMGLAPSEPLEVSGKLFFDPIDPALFTDAMDRVLERNNNLRAMRHQVDVNRAFVSAQRSNYFPVLAAFGNYQYQMAKNTLNFSTNDFIASSSVGLNLSFSLFGGLQTNARVEQAEIDVKKVEETVTGLETNLRTAVHSTILQLQQARKRIEAQGKTVEQAGRGYKIATTRFLSGSGTQLEVSDAQIALTQAQVNRFQAIFDYLVAGASFDQLLSVYPKNIRTNQE